MLTGAVLGCLRRVCCFRSKRSEVELCGNGRACEHNREGKSDAGVGKLYARDRKLRMEIDIELGISHNRLGPVP